VSEKVKKMVDPAAALEKKPAEIEELEKGVCIQAQITFTRTDGTKLLKVVTVKRPVSYDRNKVESNVDSTVVALQAIQESARIAQAGAYQDSRINLLSVQRLLQRAMRTPKHQKDYLSFIVQAEVKFQHLLVLFAHIFFFLSFLFFFSSFLLCVKRNWTSS
jgi:hypothetical protein